MDETESGFRCEALLEKGPGYVLSEVSCGLFFLETSTMHTLNFPGDGDPSFVQLLLFLCKRNGLFSEVKCDVGLCK